MPGATGIDAVESILEKSLSLKKSKSTNLDQKIASSAQRLLQQVVEFVPAKKPYSVQFSSLKSKYVLLKSSKKDEETSNKNNPQTLVPSLGQRTTSVENGPGDAKMGEILPIPRVVIYPSEKVQLGWRQMHKVGGGLINMGNTCFLNATLQCLTYTPPLVNYCLSDEHPKTCKQVGFCLMCTMRQHIKTALHHSGSAFRPNSFLHKLKYIAKHFRHGRQEDAHEFLRLLTDGLQKACLGVHKKLDKLSKETTVIHQIFGGFLRSQVQCLKCSARSNTYEPFMDLSLNLKDVSTVEAALAKFVRPESLDSANAYACERCRQKTPARKRFSLHKIPNVLTIQLNRFGYSRAAGKINKHVQFPDKLNIRPYMSHRQGEAENYSLYAVLIHSGHHCNMGHYYCYIRAPSNVWYIMNDASVHPVSASRVFGSQAYLLFYSKLVPSLSQAPPKAPLIAPSPTPNGLVSPKFNGAFNKQAAGKLSRASGDVGVPVSRQMVSPTKLLQSPFSTGSLSQKGKHVLPDAQQPAPKDMLWTNQNDRCSSGGKASGGIVMQVKDGKVVTRDKSEAGASKIYLKPLKKAPSFLADISSVKHRDSKTLEKGENHSDRNKENLTEKIARSVSDSFKFSKQLFKKKCDQSGFDEHHIQKSSKVKPGELHKNVMGSSDPPALRKEDTFNLTPKLKKDPSRSGSKIPPLLKRENCDGANKLTERSSQNLEPKLKKFSSSAGNRVNKVPALTRVNSSPAVHNVWHVHAITVTPSSSLSFSSSSHSIPSANGAWTVNTNGKHSESVEKRQHLHDTLTTGSDSRKRPLMARALSSDHTKKRRLSLPVQEKRDKFSDDGHRDSVETTKMNPEKEFMRVQSDRSRGPTTKPVLNSPMLSTQNNNPQNSSKTSVNQFLLNDHTVHNDGESNTLDTASVVDSTLVRKKSKKHKKKKRLHMQTDDEQPKTEYSTVNKTSVCESSQPANKQKETNCAVTDNCPSPSDTPTPSKDKILGQKRKRDINWNVSDGEDLPEGKNLKLSESESTLKKHSDGTPGKEKHVQRGSNKTVPVQRWDHFVKDSLLLKKKQDQGPTLMWVDSGNSKMLEELCKRPAVTTWSGEKSVAEIEAEKEEKQRKKKSWKEQYEEEIDRGKLKKVKKKVADLPWAFNPFQKFQNHRNQEKFKWDEDFGPGRKTHSFSDRTVSTLERSQSDTSSFIQHQNRMVVAVAGCSSRRILPIL